MRPGIFGVSEGGDSGTEFHPGVTFSAAWNCGEMFPDDQHAEEDADGHGRRQEEAEEVACDGQKNPRDGLRIEPDDFHDQHGGRSRDT